GCLCVGTSAAPTVREHGISPPRLSRCRQMSPSRQPSSSQRAGAGHRPPHAVRLSSLILPLLVSSPCAENRLAQVLLCNSPQEAPLETDEPKARLWADSPRGASAADFAGSVHFQKETCDGYCQLSHRRRGRSADLLSGGRSGRGAPSATAPRLPEREPYVPRP